MLYVLYICTNYTYTCTLGAKKNNVPYLGTLQYEKKLFELTVLLPHFVRTFAVPTPPLCCTYLVEFTTR